MHARQMSYQLCFAPIKAQVGLELTAIISLQSPKCFVYGGVPPCVAREAGAGGSQ